MSQVTMQIKQHPQCKSSHAAQCKTVAASLKLLVDLRKVGSFVSIKIGVFVKVKICKNVMQCMASLYSSGLFRLLWSLSWVTKTHRI